MTRLVVKLPADCAELPARAYLIRHYGISNSQWKRLKHTGDFRKNGFSANATHTMVQNGDILTFESEKPPLTPSPSSRRTCPSTSATRTTSCSP